MAIQRDIVSLMDALIHSESIDTDSLQIKFLSNSFVIQVNTGNIGYNGNIYTRFHRIEYTQNKVILTTHFKTSPLENITIYREHLSSSEMLSSKLSTTKLKQIFLEQIPHHIEPLDKDATIFIEKLQESNWD